MNKSLLTIAVLVTTLTACESPSNLTYPTGVTTTEEYLDENSPYAVSAEDAPGILSEAGGKTGEILKDVNEDIGKGLENTKDFIEKL